MFVKFQTVVNLKCKDSRLSLFCVLVSKGPKTITSDTGRIFARIEEFSEGFFSTGVTVHSVNSEGV